ncbi:MAG: hypothetical protein MUE46_04880 [Xanthomonadales bacterium]|jgi:hypothetical protein|nr:hypothetical protein [Xanthomonadales bacterium]
MKRSKLILIIAGTLLFTHVSLFPYIMLFGERMDFSERFNLLLLIAPLTAAYVTSIVKFAIDNPGGIPGGDQAMGALYMLVAFFCIAPFSIAIFSIFYFYETHMLNDLDEVRQYIGMIEIYFGAMFGLFISSVFGGDRG